jgi:hypothetical protein
MKTSRYYALALALVSVSSGVAADERGDYYQRVAARDTALFHALDVDHDDLVTRSEAQGDLDFGPRFNDMDINRDGVVTLPELQRYIEQQYGVRASAR